MALKWAITPLKGAGCRFGVKDWQRKSYRSAPNFCLWSPDWLVNNAWLVTEGETVGLSHQDPTNVINKGLFLLNCLDERVQISAFFHGNKRITLWCPGWHLHWSVSWKLSSGSLVPNLNFQLKWTIFRGANPNLWDSLLRFLLAHITVFKFFVDVEDSGFSPGLFSQTESQSIMG